MPVPTTGMGSTGTAAPPPPPSDAVGRWPGGPAFLSFPRGSS